jgi:hypothetical protein
MKHHDTTSPNCIQCGSAEVVSRALCKLDYRTCWELVRDHKTTWKALENAGLAAPSNRYPRHLKPRHKALLAKLKSA